MTDVILDCDPGHDDAIAILLALASPELNLLGITTVAGNTTLDHATGNAIRVLDVAGRPDVPVAAGAERPLTRELRTAPEVHGPTGLDGPILPPASRAAEAQHAIDWIAATVQHNRAPVTLIATGPLTNIALLLARHPQAAARLSGIVLMGGAIGLGNVTPAAEFNIWVDPEAADRVFRSGMQLTMVGLDVTHQALMTPAHADRLRASDTPGARLVADLHGFYVEPHRRRYGWEGAPIHDAMAVAHVIDATLLQTRHLATEIDTGPEPGRGRTYVDAYRVTGRGPNCHVAEAVDAERFLALLLDRLER
jgi:pyrimidine-specific ribonucleoside hydrolase